MSNINPSFKIGLIFENYLIQYFKSYYKIKEEDLFFIYDDNSKDYIRNKDNKEILLFILKNNRIMIADTNKFILLLVPRISKNFSIINYIPILSK